MAKSKRGESKQGLVITLVFFILATIGLGVATYYGFADQEAKDKEVKKAKADLEVIKKDREWYKYQALQSYAYMGQKVNFEDLGLLRAQYDSGTLKGKDKPEVDPIIKALDTELRWNAAAKRPGKTYPDLLKEEKQKVATLEVSNKKLLDDKKAAEAREQAKIKELADARKNYDAELKKVADSAKKGRTDDRTDLETLRTGFTKEIDKFKAKLEEMAGEKRKVEQVVRARDTTIKGLREQLKVKSAELAESRRSPTDVPVNLGTKWRIVSIDRRGERPYINLGSADRVRPQLTFSVHAVGSDGKVDPVAKATIEVVKVIRDHLSQARVTSIKDPARDPILKDDVLYNPAWDPHLQKHIALVGIIDLAGDGHDDTQEFIRNLKKQNIIVDAWTDTKDKELPPKGSGITVRTDYLIVGSGRGSLSEARDPAFAGNLDKAIKAARDKAKENGVTVIGLRKYLDMIGYVSPRGVSDKPAGTPGRAGY